MVGDVLGKDNECNRDVCHGYRCYIVAVYLFGTLYCLKEGEIGDREDVHILEYFKVDYLKLLIVGHNSDHCEYGCRSISCKYSYDEGDKLSHFLTVDRADGHNKQGDKSAKDADKRICKGVAVSVKNLSF